MKKLADALKKSLKDTSRELTAEMRDTAIQQGWDANVANGLTLQVGLGNLAMAVKSNIQNRALDLEYGTSDASPNSVMRKFTNNRQKIEKTIIANLENEIGFKL